MNEEFLNYIVNEVLSNCHNSTEEWPHGNMPGVYFTNKDYDLQCNLSIDKDGLLLTVTHKHRVFFNHVNIYDPKIDPQKLIKKNMVELHKHVELYKETIKIYDKAGKQYGD